MGLAEEVNAEGPRPHPLTRWRRAILLLVVAAAPLIFLPGIALAEFNLGKIALLFAGIAVAAALRVTEWSFGVAGRPDLRGALLPVAALAVALIVGWAFSPYKVWAILGYFYRYQGLVPYLAVLLLCLLLADAFRRDPLPIAKALTLSGGLVGAYALLQVAGLDPRPTNVSGDFYIRVTTFMGNSNYTGSFAAVVLPIAVGAWFHTRSRLLAAGALLVLCGLIASFSEAAIFSGIAATLVVVAGIFRARSRLAVVVATTMALATALLLGGVVMYSTQNPSSETVGPSIRMRAWAWEAGVRLTAESPIVGRGPNAYAIEGPHHRSFLDGLYANFESTDDPHSLLFSMLTAAGVFGIAALALIVLWAVRRATLIASSQERNEIGYAFLGGVIAYLLVSLVTVDEPALRIAFWSSVAGAAIASVGVREATGGIRRSAALRIPTAVAAAALALVVVGWSVGFVLADFNAKRGLELFALGDVEEASDRLDSALAFRDEYIYRRLYAIQLGAAIDPTRPASLAYVDRIRGLMSYLDHFPEVRGFVNYGRILNTASSLDADLLEDSLEQYLHAFQLDEVNPLIRVEASDVMLRANQPGLASDVLEPYLIFVGELYPQYWGAVARTRVALNDFEAARHAVERALGLDPNDQRAQAALAVLEARREK